MPVSPIAFVHPSFAGRVGIARTEITPPIGIYARTWGAANHDVAESIHRPLTLSALVVSQQDQQPTLVFVDADLSWWRTNHFFRQFQARLLQDFAIDRANLVFGLTHTHAAPPLMATEDSQPGGELLNRWFEDVYQATVRTVRDALANQFSAVIEWHYGKCRLASVRDLPDPACDSKRVVCGFDPAQTADDTLLVGRISDGQSRLRAIVVNYACHPTTLAWENKAISPDFVGSMRATIEEFTGAAGFFMQGASGELAPRLQYVADPEVADRHGRQLGFAALSTLEDMEPPATELAFDRVVESGAPLAVWKHHPRTPSRELRARLSTVDLPLKDWPSADELERERNSCSDRALAERLRRKRDIRRDLGEGKSFPLSIWVWRIGDAVLVGSSCESYSHLQRQLRQRFPGTAVICTNLINGSIGYLPPSDAYDADIYQAWQTPFARGSLELVIEHMAEQIAEILPTDLNTNT